MHGPCHPPISATPAASFLKAQQIPRWHSLQLTVWSAGLRSAGAGAPPLRVGSGCGGGRGRSGGAPGARPGGAGGEAWGTGAAAGGTPPCGGSGWASGAAARAACAVQPQALQHAPPGLSSIPLSKQRRHRHCPITRMSQQGQRQHHRTDMVSPSGLKYPTGTESFVCIRVKRAATCDRVAGRPAGGRGATQGGGAAVRASGPPAAGARPRGAARGGSRRSGGRGPGPPRVPCRGAATPAASPAAALGAAPAAACASAAPAQIARCMHSNTSSHAPLCGALPSRAASSGAVKRRYV